ncbi:MAG: protein-L-isoaspartate(D-aspartate) O-methyltransferase [Acidobacteriota bacterium]
MTRRTPGAQARRLVERLRERGIRSQAVLDAIARVPRQEFVPEPIRFRAWEDVRLPIGLGQTISQPWTVARMCELAGDVAGRRVLEIGTGSGYHAAVLAELGAIVFSVERHAGLADRAARTLRRLGYLGVSVKQFDGTYGWAAEAPYAAIVTTAAGPDVPDALVRQLGPGGRLVLPVARGGGQRLLVVRRAEDGEVIETDCGPASFVPLVGRFGYRAGPGRDPDPRL